MPSEILPILAGRLSGEEPQTSRRRASVAVILSGGAAPKVLLIKRSERNGDPWSGQIAFPGGKHQEGDASAKDTAVREAREEVGIDLDSSSEFLGYFGSFRTHTGDMDVVPAIFLLRGEVAVRVNDEAVSFMWVGLERFLAPEARVEIAPEIRGARSEVPAFREGDYVIWGLTYRIITALLEGVSA
jgi:8-oxo-dGTP pyrophosphatase MutT (NUDIX family)